MNIDRTIASQVLFTALASAVFTGILAFAAQSFIKQWLSSRMEEFKKDLQLAAFEYQTWWKLKVETYSQIMASLVDLQYCFERWFDSYMYQEVDLTPQVKEELGKEYRQARKHLAKTAAAGAYIVSVDATAALQELLCELDRRYRGNWFEELNIHYSAAKECIAKLSEYAKTDLHAIE